MAGGDREDLRKRWRRRGVDENDREGERERGSKEERGGE